MRVANNKDNRFLSHVYAIMFFTGNIALIYADKTRYNCRQMIACDGTKASLARA